MIYIKSNEHNITNNYNDKVKMILRSRLEANIKYVVTTLYSAIKMGMVKEGMAQCGQKRTKGRGRFFNVFADVLYGCSRRRINVDPSNKTSEIKMKI